MATELEEALTVEQLAEEKAFEVEEQRTMAE